jgi:hypothetical protein
MPRVRHNDEQGCGWRPSHGRWEAVVQRDRQIMHGPSHRQGGLDRKVLSRRHVLAAAAASLTLACTGGATVHRQTAGTSAKTDADPTAMRVAAAPARPSASASPATARVTATQPPVPIEPRFSDVAAVTPDEALLYLAGRHPRYPGAGLDSLMGYSAADILETMDTDVLDTVAARHGADALVSLTRAIAGLLLDALLAVYGGARVLLALDAGHGGNPGVFYDPGSNGTEAVHTREVAAAVEDLAADGRYGTITIRRIFNDAIGDDFGLPPPYDTYKSAAALTIRNVRGSMLAYEAAAWNRDHPDAPVAVHVVSIHFNAGSKGILVLHQGEAVPADFRARSIAYARDYLAAALPALSATGLLPYTLRPALGTGLSDDTLLYAPPYAAHPINPLTGVDRSKLPRRYAMLQASPVERDYAEGVLRYRGLT